MNDVIKLKKNTDFHIRINSIVKEAVDDLAAKDGRTTSEYIRKMLLQELKRNKVKIELNEKIF